MKKKRIIFDLDGTLLTGDFSLEKKYFSDLYGDNAKKLNEKIGSYLDEYERTYHKYDVVSLSHFLTIKSGLVIPVGVVLGWIDVMKDVSDTMEDGVLKTLEYLKKKDVSLAILTNWFGDTQLCRLKRAGILEYFDHIYTGEFVLKPHKNAYLTAKGDFSESECLFLGDNLDKDYIGPRTVGVDSFLYDKSDIYGDNVAKIKRIDKLIDKY